LPFVRPTRRTDDLQPWDQRTKSNRRQSDARTTRAHSVPTFPSCLTWPLALVGQSRPSTGTNQGERPTKPLDIVGIPARLERLDRPGPRLLLRYSLCSRLSWLNVGGSVFSCQETKLADMRSACCTLKTKSWTSKSVFGNQCASRIQDGDLLRTRC
jgi:hypothetical protein